MLTAQAGSGPGGPGQTASSDRQEYERQLIAGNSMVPSERVSTSSSDVSPEDEGEARCNSLALCT